MKFIIYLFYFIFTLNLYANEISISNLKKDTNVLKYTKYYIDIDSKKDFEYIKSNKELFKSFEKDYIAQGYSLNTIWLSFSIHNDSNKNISRFLELDNTMLDEIILYEKLSKDKYKKITTGVLHRKEFNSFMRYKFQVNLKAEEKKEYYLKARSETSGLYFHLNLLEEKEYYSKDIKYQHILVLFFGAILALSFYNLFIFFFTKEKAYLYYVGYMLFNLITHISFTSMNLHILPLEFEYIDAYLALYYLFITSTFMLLFTKEFLKLKEYELMRKIFDTLIILTILFTFITLFMDYYPMGEATLYAMGILLFCVYASLYAFFKKIENARYLLIGWSAAVFGYMMLAFKQANLWSIINYLPYFFEFTLFLEAILFSIALASKLNKTKELEQSVATNEVLTRELHHRVKNNMQFIILMYRLKLANLTDDKIDEKLKETEGSIQAISKTHEILYNQDNLENIDTKLYFENLIEELKRSFDTRDVVIKLDIQTSLDTQKSIYCGIILNELITNSFKYAFSKNSGEINISLLKKEKGFQFIIKDNGVGFNYKEKFNDSFGLSFVEAMVKDELKGKVNFKNDDGSKIKINF